MNFFHRLWLRFGRLKPLLVEPQGLAPTPTEPAGEAREPVNDEDSVRMRALVTRHRDLMDLLCTHANAYVYRDYGAGYVVEYDCPAPTIDEGTQLEIDRVATCQ
jgi:hypothetical protein